MNLEGGEGGTRVVREHQRIVRLKETKTKGGFRKTRVLADGKN